MIISASRRTDIPAFYSDWFINRVKENYVLVRNPMNSHAISRVVLTSDLVECIVFWTKNPQPMLNKLPILDRMGFRYYFQFTLTSYDQEIEENVPKKTDLLPIFIRLSETIGTERVIWRYDPIFFTPKIDENYHVKYFDFLAKTLSKYTIKCVVSFLDMYKKTERNIVQLRAESPNEPQMQSLGRKLSQIARSYDLILESCSEEIDLSDAGVNPGKCIDDCLVSQLLGKELDVKKDSYQRKVCGCVASIDIGTYNTCKHGCRYCYANSSSGAVSKNSALHDPQLPLIFGEPNNLDKITERKLTSCLKLQPSLL